MCYNPITIRNKNKFYRPGIDKLYLTVPCGRCLECSEAKQKEYIFRTYMEWKKFGDSFGYDNIRMFFFTFTYNKFHVPFEEVTSLQQSVSLSDYSSVKAYSRRRMVLDFSDVQRMLKIVRKRANDAYPGIKISYLAASEFGSKYEYKGRDGKMHKASYRPHYHLIFIVSAPVSKALFLTWCKKGWRKFKDQFSSDGRSLGNIDDDEIRITDFKERSSVWDSVAYVCKYVNKYDERSPFGRKSQNSRLRVSLNYGMFDNLVHSDNFNIPEPYISEKEYHQGFKFLPLGKTSNKGGFLKKFMIPQVYYLRKRLKLKDVVPIIAKEKNASYVRVYKILLYYLFRQNRTLDQYGYSHLMFSPRHYLKNKRFLSSWLESIHDSKLTSKADRIIRDIPSAFLYSFRPDILHDFLNYYGITFDFLRSLDSFSYEDKFDYLVNIRPYIYYSFNRVDKPDQECFDENYKPKFYKFPQSFYRCHERPFSDCFSYDVPDIEFLFLFYDFYKAYTRTLREDSALLKYSKELPNHLLLKSIKFKEEIQNDKTSSKSAMFSGHCVSSIKLWYKSKLKFRLFVESSRYSSTDGFGRVAS